MDDQHRRAWASIDGDALTRNLGQVRALSPEAGIYAVIKANAYGHGMAEVARLLAQSRTPLAGFAVATMDEALSLAALELQLPIVILNGFTTKAELTLCLEQGFEPVVHAPHQLALLEKHFNQEILGGKRKLWLKVNTGMNRLGFQADDCIAAYQRLCQFPGVEITLMSHLACADAPDDEAAQAFTRFQLDNFAALRARLVSEEQARIDCSLLASPGLYSVPQAHYQRVRPGIMLYGASPLAGKTSEDLGLHPVMTLSARLLAINEVPAGASIGYGASFTCERDTRVGVVSIGYGDGYPRHAGTGTPVVVRSQGGDTRTALIGRVSMDTLTIDLTGVDSARVGDEVELWGKMVSADEIARATGTIAYELFCQVTQRVPRLYDQ